MLNADSLDIVAFSPGFCQWEISLAALTALVLSNEKALTEDRLYLLQLFSDLQVLGALFLAETAVQTCI